MEDFELNDYEDIQRINEYDPDYIKIGGYTGLSNKDFNCDFYSGIWKTKDGKEIEIKDIEKSHLINIIKYLNNKNKNICKWIKIFKKEMKRRK